MAAEDMSHEVGLDALIVEFTAAVGLLDGDARDGTLPPAASRDRVLAHFAALLASQDGWGAPVPLWEGHTTLAAFFDLAVAPSGTGCLLGDELLTLLRSERGSQAWSEALLHITGIGFRIVCDDVVRFVDAEQA